MKTKTAHVLDQFITLASIDSLSRHEGKVAAYLAERLRELGAAVTVDHSAVKTGSDTGNIFARVAGNIPSAPTVLLCAHMDTIGSTAGMVPTVRDGMVSSNGKTVLGADDKAGVAIILAVLDHLATEKLPHGNIEIVLTVQEELGMFGAKHLGVELKADLGYILDGDGAVGTIINLAPSKIDLDLSVTGQAAHAGVCPELGINAIVVAATAISRLRSGRIDDETTSNFGTIHGGQLRNIVAEQVEVVVEVRSMNDAKLERETQAILDMFSKTAAEFNARFLFKKEIPFKSFHIAADHPAVAIAQQAAAAIGVKPVLWKTGGGLDANIFNARGLPCVGLGIGIEDPHSSREHIPVAQLEEGVRLVLAILQAAAAKDR